MKELYFIETLGSFHNFAIIAAIALITTSIILLGNYICNYNKNDINKILKKDFIITLIFGVLNMLLAVFIPNKQSLYVIYGVGTTIDYLQENPEVKAIPDKTIHLINVALDRAIDKDQVEADTLKNS